MTQPENPGPAIPPTTETPDPYKILLDSEIHNGYTDQLSYDPEETVHLYINGKKTLDRIKLPITNTLGKVVDYVKLEKIAPQNIKSDRPYEEGFNYEVTGDYRPANLKSGIYMIAGSIPLIIKGKSSHTVILLDTNTVLAYNCDGGKSFYIDCTTKLNSGSTKIMSFLKPMSNFTSRLNAYNFAKWYDQNGMQADYITDFDLDDPSYLQNRKLLIIAGHSEYWTRLARTNFDQFIVQGGNAAIFSGNIMWWQVRYDKTKKQIICYKNSDADPIEDPLLKTINWHKASLEYPISKSIGAEFTHGGYNGNRVTRDPSDLYGWNGIRVMAPTSYAFEGTSVRQGDLISFYAGTKFNGELDGLPSLGVDTLGQPILDTSHLAGSTLTPLGFDHTYNPIQSKPGLAVYFEWKKSPTSGTIVDMPTNTWSWMLSLNPVTYPGQPLLSKITKNIIQHLQP